MQKDKQDKKRDMPTDRQVDRQTEMRHNTIPGPAVTAATPTVPDILATASAANTAVT